MRTSLFLAAGLIAIAAAMPAAAQDNPTIVVTGKSLADTERELRECIARHCPPDEDVAATLAHAENQFVAGKYKDARTTLLAGIGRNKRFARDYPIPVSDLLRANSRVAAHLGESQAYRIGTIESLDAMRAGLSPDDPRVLVQRVELADMEASFGRFESAQNGYAAVARDARRLGHTRVEAFAMLRSAWLWTAMAKDDPARYGTRARRALDGLSARTEPEFRPYAGAARVIRARLDAAGGDRHAFDALIADYVKLPPVTRPVLLYSEPIDLSALMLPERKVGGITSIDQAQAATTTARQTGIGSDDQWIDVIFWIKPDGSTGDIEIARRGPKRAPLWEKPVLESIATRRYAPLALDPSDPGIMRVERYTLTSDYTHGVSDVTGTRLRNREVNPKVEMLDLSAEPQPASGKGR
jgi:hypothetical protein